MAKRKREKKYKGISRIDQPGRHGVGWYARVRFEGTTHTKYFADGAHGGTEAALRKALRWRNSKEREVGKPRTDRVIAGRSSRNRSGVPGVFRMRSQYVVAWSPSPGELVRDLVSISKYGKQGALKRAIALRRKRERAMYGAVLPTRKSRRRR
jgi:hypothetical protein